MCRLLTSLMVTLLAATPAVADYLVTRDGRELAISGSWEQRGRLVVFRQADGTLASLRVDSLDLEASIQLSEHRRTAAAEPVAPAPPAPRAPILVLTDDDVKPFREEGEEPPAATSEEAVAAAELAVVSWQRDDDYDGLGVRLLGLLDNSTANQVADVTLSVMLYDAEGKLLGAEDAELTTTTLGPGERSQFRAEFTDVSSFAIARFEPASGRRYLTGGAPEAAALAVVGE